MRPSTTKTGKLIEKKKSHPPTSLSNVGKQAEAIRYLKEDH